MREAVRKKYLKEMGIDLYRPVLSGQADDMPEEVFEEPTEDVAENLTGKAKDANKTESLSAEPEQEQLSAISTTESDDDLTSYMQMDEAMPDQDLDADTGLGSADQPPVDDLGSLNWDQLQERISACEKCSLCKTRSQTVFGVGKPDADVMIIGEAPGAEEDKQGEPFVGAAGKLLDNMLKAIGLDRQKVFIANILKCRPPSNRNPSIDEADACEAYLLRQIDLIQPKLILSVGGVSAKNLLKTEEAVGRLRQQKQQMVKRNIPLLVTYHPAYLLRKPSEKAKSWADLKKLKQMMSDLNIS